MKRVVHVLPAADRDIERCFCYLRDESGLDRAFRFLQGLQDSFDLIQLMPFVGSPRNFSRLRARSLRKWPVKGFKDILIFYKVTKDHIEVSRILHTKRDIQTILDDQN